MNYIFSGLAWVTQKQLKKAETGLIMITRNVNLKSVPCIGN